jgi:serine/threonine protein kinase
MRQSGQDQQTAAWRKNMHSEPPARHDDFFGETVSLPDALPAPPAPPAPMAVAVEGPATISGRIGQYEIIRALGRGGMGEVHLARDLRLGRLVAVKLLTGQCVRLTERFLAEARTTARCNHENIVVIHEVGEATEIGGDPYMVLEYLEGRTLRQWLEEQTTLAVARGASMHAHAPVPPGRAVELMLPVVRALAYAHERGIVHRNLKPENIMLTHAGTIKVLDFGIAKLLSAPEHIEGTTTTPELLPSAMSSSALIGTLPYMSPEQMNMGAIDHRSDLWAVGIMLFEMVTGRHPVPSLSMGDLMDATDDEVPMPSVRDRMPDIGPLCVVIDRCLLKNPQHRTASARELLAELEALAPGHRMVRLRHDGNPFAGLAAFQEADADRFFGRTRDIDQVALTPVKSDTTCAGVTEPLGIRHGAGKHPPCFG